MPRVSVIGMPPSRDSSIASSSRLASMASATRSSTSVRSVDISGTARRDRGQDRAGRRIDRLERLARLGLRPLPADQHPFRARSLDEIRGRYLADIDRLGHWLTSYFPPGEGNPRRPCPAGSAWLCIQFCMLYARLWFRIRQGLAAGHLLSYPVIAATSGEAAKELPCGTESS